MSLLSIATKAAGAASTTNSAKPSIASAGSSVAKAASGVGASSTTKPVTSATKPSGPPGVAAIANAWSAGSSASPSRPAVVKTISAAGKAAAAAKTAEVNKSSLAKANSSVASVSRAEQLSPGWSRDANGKLKYESDPLSQLVIPGRGAADQFASHVANGDYGRAGLALAAWVLEDIVVVATLGASQVENIGTKLASATAGATANQTERALSAGQLQINKAAGAEFQRRVNSMGAASLDNFVEEVSIRPNTAEGVADFRIRIDGMGTKPGTQSVEILEAKGSATAPLTKNQVKGFPLVGQYGGTVVGESGGGAFPAGTAISPGTIIRVIRPDHLEK